ncbi:MAG: DUF4397 domain-containing protein [Peptostreptococcaceae bacterium]
MRVYDETHSLIRFINAVVDSDAIDIYIDDKLFYSDLTFTSFSPYIYITKNQYLIEIYPKDDKTKLLFSKTIQIGSEKLFSIAITGNMKKMSIIKIRDDKEPSETGDAKVRFVHLVPNGREIDVVLDKSTYIYNVMYKDVTPYSDVESKLYNAQILLSSNKQLLRKLRINLKSYKVYTFYAIGTAPNFQIFQSADGAIFLD